MTKPRSFGVSSTSAAPLRMKTPGLTKFGCPSSLFVRSVGSRLTGDLRPVPVCASRRPWRFHRLNGPPANDRDVDDRVEAARLVVGRIAVARREEGRPLDAQPVLVDRELRRAPICALMSTRCAGDRVVGLVAEHLVERVGDVPAGRCGRCRPSRCSTRRTSLVADEADRRRARRGSRWCRSAARRRRGWRGS